MIIRDAMFHPFLHSLLPRILPPDRKRIRSKEGTTVTVQRRTRKWMPSPLVTRPKHAHRSACTPIDNRIISREPARRLMSALMNNRLRMALCRRSINRSTNGYREFTPRNPDIRLCAIVIHPSPDSGFFSGISLLDARTFEDNASRFEFHSIRIFT